MRPQLWRLRPVVLRTWGACLLAATISLWPVSANAQSFDGVSLLVEPASVEVQLGETLDLTVTVTNDSAQSTARLIVHIDITDPARSSSVDPEDWTETLSRSVGVIEAGASAVVEWSVQPISGGEFALYAVALASDSAELAASNVMIVSVKERRNLNPQGILPVALGIPLVIGGLLAVQTRLVRRDAARE